MRKELEKYGIQMPAFSKIGGILANELSVDEAACKCHFIHGWGVTCTKLILLNCIARFYIKRSFIAVNCKFYIKIE